MEPTPAANLPHYPNPAEVLLERLNIGGSSPDDELYERAIRCGRFFKDNPAGKIIWKPILQATRRDSLTRPLWKAIEGWMTTGAVEPF